MHLYTLAQKLRNKCPLLLVLNLFNLFYLSVSLSLHLGTKVCYNLKPLKLLLPVGYVLAFLAFLTLQRRSDC